MPLKIITRQQWNAKAPKHKANISLPTPELWLHHTGGNERGPAGMRGIQKFHQDVKGWFDIAYSYVIDPFDLGIYEARGAGQIGGHTYGHNSKSHAICVMGNFQKVQPKPELIDTIADLVRHGHDQGWWPATLTGGHQDVVNTDCPGKYLYEQIPTINELALRRHLPTTTSVDKIDRLADRLWNMEMLSLIDWAFRFHHNRTPSREEMNQWLDMATEEGAEFVLHSIPQLKE